MSELGHSLPIHLATVSANVRYYPNSDLSRWKFATRSAPKRVVSVTPIQRPAAARNPTFVFSHRSMCKVTVNGGSQPFHYVMQ